jgi:hypothetical protein
MKSSFKFLTGVMYVSWFVMKWKKSLKIIII